MSSGYGPTVTAGVIAYLSPSGITTADPSQPGGCFRRWWYKYVMGLKEPFTGSQSLGVDTHAEIEHHLLTGEVTLGRLALSAREFIPEPAPGRQGVEVQIPEGVLTIEGIRVVGHIDLVRLPEDGGHLYSVDPVGDVIQDPIGTVEVVDWKTTSDVGKWAKQGPDLVKTVQMPLYAKYITAQYPQATHVRISHVYMQTKGSSRSQKSTALLNREQIDTRWDEIRGVVRTLKTVAQATRPEDVPANRDACGAFRGCPRMDICPRSVKESLADIFGITKSEEIRGNKTMSLLDDINALSNEQAAAGNPMATPAPAPTAAVPPGFAEDWAVIEASDQGTPPVFGDAAQALAALKGWGAPAQGYAGQGKLGTLRQLTLADVKTLADNLRGRQAAAAPQAEVGLTPPNTPAPAVTPEPAPVVAPAPTAQIVIPPAPAIVVPQTPADVAKLDAAEDARLDAAPAHVVTTNDETLLAAMACREKGSFSTMRKPDIAEAFCSLADAYEGGAPAAEGPEKMGDTAAYEKGYADGCAYEADAWKKAGAQTPAEAAAGFRLFINAVPSCPADRLDDYTAKICRLLEEQTGCKDIRCSDHDRLSFGKWKGAVAACVRAMPLEDGVYVIETWDEITEIVASTLCEAASVWVRGLR